MLYIASCIDCALTGRYVTWLPGARLQCWMLLTVYTLPQLAVSAKILCLLMVVICGAMPTMVRSVRLFSMCSHRYVNVFSNGTVVARSEPNDQPNLTISAGSYNLDLLIHSPIHDMYICFNRSRLVGRRLTRSQAKKQSSCLFKEEFVNGYSRYYLSKNADRYIGFTEKGTPIRRLKNRYGVQQKCLNLMKESQEFDLDRHNTMLAGDLNKWRNLRRLRPASQNSIKPPCHGVRHRHGRHQRRRNCYGT